MKNILYDTSSLLAIFTENHPNHNKTIDIFIAHKNNGANLYITNHTLAEFFRHFTSNRGYFIYDAKECQQVINRSVIANFETVDLDTEDYKSVIDQMDDLSLSGAVIYDALIAHAAQKVDAEELVTYNIKDFKRVWPLTNADLIEP